MEHVNVIFSLIGVLFLAIIGVYVWTFKVARDTTKQLGDVYNTVNRHFQNAGIHTDKEEFVSAKVCVVVHANIDKKMDEIGCDVKKLLRVGG